MLLSMMQYANYFIGIQFIYTMLCQLPILIHYEVIKVAFVSIIWVIQYADIFRLIQIDCGRITSFWVWMDFVS